MPSGGSSEHPQRAASPAPGTIENRSTPNDSTSVPPPRTASASASTAIDLDNCLSVDDAPLPHAEIGAAYDAVDEAIKDSAKHSASVDAADVPVPPAQVIGAAYDEADAAIKEFLKNPPNIQDVPPHPSLPDSYRDVGMGEDDMNVKKRAEPKTYRKDNVNTTAPPRDEETVQMLPPLFSSSPLDSHDPGPSDVSNIRGRQQIPAGPTSQLAPPTDTDVPPLSREPSTPVLEATLVREIPIFDAIHIPAEEPAVQEEQTWLQKNQKYIIFGGMGLLFGMVILLGVYVYISLGSNGTTDSDGSSALGEILPSTTRPSESYSPSQDPSLRPTIPPSESSLPSQDPSLRPTLRPSQSSSSIPSASVRPTAPSSDSPSKIPSPFPSFSPSSSIAPAPIRHCIKINIVYDQYPDETTWQISKITNVDGVSNANVIFESSPGVAGVCLETGEYEFTIFDSQADGICCGYGEGSYEVTSDGVVIGQGGDFGSSETISFSLPIPSPPPSESASPSEFPSSSLQPSTSPPPTTYWSSLSWNLSGQGINGEEPYDKLGDAVAVSADGMTMAIGAPGHQDQSDLVPGYVKVYHREGEGSSWAQRGDTIYGEADGDGFGRSLSLSENGEILSVGAPRIRFEDSGSGKVSVYKWDEAGLNHNQLGDILLGESAGEMFGDSLDLSLDGKTLAIGSRFYDANGYGSGKVKIYTLDETASQYEQRGVAIVGASTGEYLGWSVTLSGDGKILAVGAPGGSRGIVAGYVNIFAWDEVSLGYKKLGEAIIGDEAGDYFGFSVSFSDDGRTLAVGAPYTNNPKTGKVKIFRWDEAASTFVQLGQSLYGDEGASWLGESVALSSDGKKLAVGARGADYVEAYGLDRDGSFQPTSRIESDSGGQFGSNVALSGDGKVLVVGANGNSSNGLLSGQVNIYTASTDKNTEEV